jgi:iron complex outermembrane receptor protein
MKHQVARVVIGRWIACGISALGSLGWAGSLLAAEIPEIMVTTERREASLQSVPVAVSAIEATALQDRQVASYQDLQRLVPSLKMTNNITSPTNLSPSLRGSLQQDASLIVAESPFGIYVDDVYISRLNGNNISLNDIERVEVLRGPQGTLYGRNTLSGAIKFVSRNPGKEDWLKVSAGAGNFDQYFVKGTAGGPIGGDWAGSIALQYNSKDGEFRNVGNTPAGSGLTPQKTDYQRNLAVRGKLRYMGIDKLDVVGALSFVDSKNDSLQLIPACTPFVSGTSQFRSHDLRVNPPPCGVGDYTVSTPTLAAPGPGPITVDPTGETKQLIASINASYDFGWATLRSITAFVKTKDFFDTDFSGVGSIIGAATVDHNQVSEELLLQGKAFDDRLSYTGGLYLFREAGDQDFGWIFLGPVSKSQESIQTNSVGVFGQADFRIWEGLKATAGLRYVHDQKKFRIDQQLDPGLPPFLAFLTIPALNHVEKGNGYSELTPKIGLDYTFQPFSVFDSLMVYGSMARGFKSGGYNGIAIFNLADATSAYRPETNWTYEGGFKSDLWDRHIRLNANYFYAHISDLTANATVGFSFPVQNVGSAAVHGLEFELTVNPIENLSVYWNATWQHGEYGALIPGSAPAQAPAKWGVQPRLPQVPTLAFTIGADYAIPVSLGDTSGMVHVGGDWFDSTSYVTSATNDFVNSPYDRLALYAGLDIGSRWNVNFAMKNVRDTADITSGSRATPGAGLGGFIQLPPREWMFSVNYKM